MNLTPARFELTRICFKGEHSPRYRGIDIAEGEICEDMKNQIFAPLARN